MYHKIAEFIRQRVAVPAEALEKAFGHSRVAYYKKGDFILRRGEYCRFIGFLNTGLIMVTIADEDGKEVVCNFCFENEFFTYVESIKDNIPSHKHFIATEDCEALLLDKGALPVVFSIHPAFEVLFNQVILEDLHRMMLHVQEKQIQSVEERYLNIMDMHPEPFHRVPLKFIAGYLGIAPPSLSRMRKRLGKKPKN